jgi:hypothetical protein
LVYTIGNVQYGTVQHNGRETEDMCTVNMIKHTSVPWAEDSIRMMQCTSMKHKLCPEYNMAYEQVLKQPVLLSAVPVRCSTATVQHMCNSNGNNTGSATTAG